MKRVIPLITFHWRGVINPTENLFPSQEGTKGWVKTSIFALLLLFAFASQAQEEEEWRTIPSVTEWLEEVNNWPEDEYIQRNIIINIDLEKDYQIVAHPDEDYMARDLDEYPLYQVNKNINVRAISFLANHRYSGIVLKNISFNNNFQITGLTSNRLGFKNVQFNTYLQIREVKTRYWLKFVDCVIRSLNGNDQNTTTPFQFTRTHIQDDSFFSSTETPLRVSLEECTVDSTLLFWAGTALTELTIANSTFHRGITLEGASITNRFELYNTSIRYLDINGTELPLLNTYIPFSGISRKICLNLGETISFKKIEDDSSILYWGQSSDELLDQFQFDKLIASYSKLLAIYKGRSEMDSYNACYIEMRDMMTARSILQYELDPTFNRYFDYQINKFTKAFSDYGTRPAKAIVIFFQVVLGFSVFYFFFPSTWNTTNSRKLMKRLSYLGGYFTSKEGLSELFEKETKDEYTDYEEFRSFMTSSEKELPVYFQWLSKPLYQASVSRFNLSKGILRRTDILNGKWSELPSGKKAMTSILIGVYLFFYLLYVLIVRMLNAITLSINAFSTLGFGEIPTRGIARYVTIIQGFVGWFLLSIFLVSLIGQILN
jgi:hypothetical protein